MQGDTLAKGGHSAVFGPPKVTAERWAEIWKEEDKKEVKAKEKDNRKLI